NALTLEMIRSIKDQLHHWKQNEKVALVFLHGEGEKAFCAGGDVKNLYSLILKAREEKTDPGLAVEPFFREEYEMDYLLHTYPKPVVVWGQGVVMGGGMGLFQAGSHSIVTDTSLLAMPEISIGLFPDVGGSWFLSRLPGKLGWYLALTGCRLNSAEVMFLGWSQFYFKNQEKGEVFKSLLSIDFQNGEDLTHRLQNLQTSSPSSENWLEKYKELASQVVQSGDAKTIYTELTKSSAEDKKWNKNKETFLKGSPTSAGIICEQLKQGKNKNLKEVFQMELIMALQCARHPDFAEGVRALLVEKTGQPVWQPKDIGLLEEAWIQGHFTASSS
ncbi:MAG: enoyl-CoA hydratase/isomerase family protein, partial [Bdellovibrionales bacterium]|nr:enoyl-CoA hydratase/isomerase family protein [Bdellovibrionales bacterium]